MEGSVEEFSLEDIQELISNAESTVRSVRDSLRRREPSPVAPAVPPVSDSDRSEPVDRQVMESPPSPPSSNNTSGSNDSGERSRPENSDDSASMGNVTSSNDSDSSGNISIEENASGGAPVVPAEQNPQYPTNPDDSVDDEVILVSETKNPNPPVIDLCSPDVGGPIPLDPPPRSRRRRREELAPEESSPPQRPLFNCVICLSDMSAKRPFSTTCGHVFCENCIKTAIQVSKRCPICRKILNMKSVHPLYLSAN